MNALTSTDYLLALPEIYLASAICVVLLFDLFFADRHPGRTAWFSMLVMLVGAAISWYFEPTESTLILNGLYVADPLASLLKVATFLAGAIALFYSRGYLDRKGLQRAFTRCWRHCWASWCWLRLRTF
jgi:NADH-quinone oxidoreductase subunit N